jgi:hypothetical protein
MARFANSIAISAAGLTLGFVLAAPVIASAQAPRTEKIAARTDFADTVDVPASKGGEPKLLWTDHTDIDADGETDTVSYFDTDKDGGVDSEVIDLGSTGKPTVVALRCDGDGDGRYDDWLVVDAQTETAKAVLLDKNDDGDVDVVAFADGSSEPIESSTTGLFRPVAHN